jgi:uncharacterized protein
MKLHLSRAADRNAFSGYGEGYVLINGVRYERSVIVLPDRVMEWPVGSFEELSHTVFEALRALPVDVIVLGTGPKLRFPTPADLQTVIKAGIGIEVMDTQAACRTYNVLLGEDRRVAAAVLMS